MKRTVKIWIIIAVLSVILGATLLSVAVIAAGFDFSKFGEDRNETNRYEIKEEFDDISIKTDTANVIFVLSDDESCKVVCYEEKNRKHSVSVTDGVLNINVTDTRKWYEYLLWGFVSQKITVYLPAKEFSSLIIKEGTGDIVIPKEIRFNSVDVSVGTGNVKCYADVTESISITTSTGDVYVENVATGRLNVAVSMGRITASNVSCEGDVLIAVSTGTAVASDIRCKNLTSTGSTGNILLQNVVATYRFSITRSTGDVNLDACDAAEIYIETSTGSVRGTLLSDKNFITNSATGTIDVPKTATGGLCEINTGTGDIRIQIK